MAASATRVSPDRNVPMYTMAVRGYVRSPPAVALTVLAAFTIGGILTVGWWAVTAVQSSSLVNNPYVLGGFGQLTAVLLAFLFVGIAILMWIPFGAGISYAVGRTLRGNPPSLSRTIGGVLAKVAPLARWTKTRFAVGPFAEYILGPDDIAQNEVAVGCEKFVIPALLLDAATPAVAADHANYVTPPPGRERLQFMGFGATGLVSGVLFVGGFLGTDTVASLVVPLAASFLVIGIVLTAAIDTAWRTTVYIDQMTAEEASI